MTRSETLALRHARAFEGQGRAWNAAEFAALLDSPHVVLTEAEHGFALTRVVANEAELLTLATDPGHRRNGVARTMMTVLEQTCRQMGVESIFLEVSAENVAARALYDASGFAEIARRKRYYRTPDGQRQDALILQKRL